MCRFRKYNQDTPEGTRQDHLPCGTRAPSYDYHRVLLGQSPPEVQSGKVPLTVLEGIYLPVYCQV